MLSAQGVTFYWTTLYILGYEWLCRCQQRAEPGAVSTWMRDRRDNKKQPVPLSLPFLYVRQNDCRLKLLKSVCTHRWLVSQAASRDSPWVMINCVHLHCRPNVTKHVTVTRATLSGCCQCCLVISVAQQRFISMPLEVRVQLKWNWNET